MLHVQLSQLAPFIKFTARCQPLVMRLIYSHQMLCFRLLFDLNDVGQRLSEYTLRVNTFLEQLTETHPALASAASASTNAPPIGEEPQLDLENPDRTEDQSDQPEGG